MQNTTYFGSTVLGSAPPSYRSKYMIAFIMVSCSLLLWASAKVQIPFFPVPMTMQSFVVILISFVMGSRLGAATVLLYLAEGALGLPVFAGTPEKGVGVAYMAGPTGGYLVGFVIAAFAAGKFAEAGLDRRFHTALVAGFTSLTLIYMPGLVWLGLLLGWDKPILEFGLYPFLPAELLKLSLIVAVMPISWQLFKRQKH